MKEETLFHQAMAISDPAERSRYLDQACEGDPALRERIEALLQSHEAEGFLDVPDQTLASDKGSRDGEHLLTATMAGGAPHSAPDEVFPIGARVSYFGDYELRSEIARGGMGVVYRARQVSLNRMVALKMILQSRLTSDSDVQRFLAEAESAANLDHPNIVPIFEVGEHDGQHYFTMKLVEGGSLAQAFDSFSPRQGADLIAQVARAVHAAHQSGILHRDIKPGNILLETDGSPCVTDFGLAKNIDAETDLTQSGQILGTPNYMSPEQARGQSKSLTTSTDIYSLGAVLYELLVGNPPFLADSVIDVLRRVAEEEPCLPLAAKPNIDRDLETITLKCLNKEPHRRYGSAEALAEDLERWLRGEPIAARRISAVEQFTKWVRRKPMLAAMLGVVALFMLTLVIGGPAVAVYQARMRKIASDLATERDALRITAENNLLRAEKNLYRTEMMVSGQALQDMRGNAQGRRMLLNWWPVAGHEDRRGWEWYWLAGLVWPENQFVLRGHTRPVQHGAFSPDGKWFYSFGAEKDYRIWNVRNRQQTGVLRGQSDIKSTTLPLFLAPDSKRLVWADRTKIHIASATDGSTIQTLDASDAHTDDVSTLCWSGDGKLIASAAYDGTVRVWNPEDGKLIRVVVDNLNRNLDVIVDFSPDSRYLAVTDREGDDSIKGMRILIFDRQKEFAEVARREVLLWWARPLWSLDRTAWSPDSEHLLIINADNRLGIWSPWGDEPDVVLEGDDNSLRNMFFADWSPDGSRIVRTIHDGTVRINDSATGKEIHRLSGHQGKARFVSWRSDGEQLASCDSAGNIKLWDLTKADPELLVTLRGHSRQVRWVGWSPNGEAFASTGSARTIRFWNLDKPLPGARIIDAGEPISGLAWNASGTQVVTAGIQPGIDASANIRILDLATGKVVGATRSGAKNVAWSPEGPIASLYSVDKLYLWNPGDESAEPIKATRKVSFPIRVYSSQPAWSPDGRRLATAQLDGVTIWDVPSGDINRIKEVGTIKSSWARMVRWSPDGQRLVIAFRGSEEQQVEVWDAQSLERIWLRKRPRDGWAYVDAVAWSPNGKLVASSDPDTSIRIWAAETGEPLAVLRGHTGGINDLDWHPDSRRLASASADGTVKVWSPDIQGEVLSLQGHEGSVNRLRWSPDGTRLASAGSDGTIRVWDAAPGYLSVASTRALPTIETRLARNTSDLDMSLLRAKVLVLSGEWERAGQQLQKWFEMNASTNSIDRWHATNWWLLGPFSSQLVREESPEKELDPFGVPKFATDSKGRPEPQHYWQVIHDADLRLLDIKQILDEEDVSAYAQTRIYSPERQRVQLEFRCHNAGRLWLNGQLVHSDRGDETRDLRSKVDKLEATLEAGWNILLAKVTCPKTVDRFGLAIELKRGN